jgi:2-dehydropantoate 2-reductase
MQGVQWGKLLVNLFNPINALANMPIQAQLMQRDFRIVFAALQEEALTVLKAANIQPTQIAAASPKMIPKLLRLPDWLFAAVAKGLLDIDPAACTSMCVDLQNGRPTEIDDLCGAVVRLAEQNGESAPLNQALCKLVKAHRPGQDWSAQRLQRELGV